MFFNNNKDLSIKYNYFKHYYFEFDSRFNGQNLNDKKISPEINSNLSFSWIFLYINWPKFKQIFRLSLYKNTRLGTPEATDSSIYELKTNKELKQVAKKDFDDHGSRTGSSFYSVKLRLKNVLIAQQILLNRERRHLI